MSKKLRVFKGRSSKGIKGIELGKDDKVISLSVLDASGINSHDVKKLLKNGSSDKDKKSEIIAKQKYILSITENGFGKRTSFYDYRVTNRGGKGITGILTNSKNGKVIDCFIVDEKDQIILVSDKGQIIRVNVNQLRIAGRSTQGVSIFKIPDKDKIVNISRVQEVEEH